MFTSKALGILTVMAFTGGMIGIANADVINVNVTDGNTPYTGLAAYANDPAGSTAAWNNVPIPYQSVTAASPLTVNSLLDSSGATTNVNLAISPIASSGTYLNRYNDNGNNSGLVPNPLTLMEGYIFRGFSATLSNVPQGGYNMYVYAVGNNANQGGTLTLSTPNYCQKPRVHDRTDSGLFFLVTLRYARLARRRRATSNRPAPPTANSSKGAGSGVVVDTSWNPFRYGPVKES